MEYFLYEKKTEIIFQNDFRIVFPKEIKKVFLIDKKVYQLFENKLGKIIDGASFFIAASEKNKSLTEVRKIYDFFKKHNVNRSTVIIGIGGGITTDITAFAASTYMRGCRLVLIPTTFLAMVDAAIGGKTAINYNGIKNNIGSFYPAGKVIIVPEFLKTLPEEEMKNGWAECIKIALIKRSPLFDMLKSKINIKNIIEKAIELKLEICEKDLEDRGERRLLNLGHTFAHILESVSKYEISHGTAVSVGIRAAAKLSLKLGLINVDINEKINNILNLYNLAGYEDAKYLDALINKGEFILNQDKKAGLKLNIVLFKGFQEVFLKEIDDSKEVLKTLEDFFE
ncbi:MAG: 3-dehydroquinate synthase [Candidatus Cloacimonetes bacterium]|nr:3-dehydroquinate synthase [Candidatus Cloacimonadota bacterium]